MIRSPGRSARLPLLCLVLGATMRDMRSSLVLLLLLACSAGAGDGAPAPERGPATLEVENRNFLDMTVYVVDGGVRQRLGVARGNATTPLTIPERLIRGRASPLRFLCDPIGGQGLPVSEEIMVEPGDTVELLVPPG